MHNYEKLDGILYISINVYSFYNCTHSYLHIVHHLFFHNYRIQHFRRLMLEKNLFSRNSLSLFMTLFSNE